MLVMKRMRPVFLGAADMIVEYRCLPWVIANTTWDHEHYMSVVG